VFLELYNFHQIHVTFLCSNNIIIQGVGSEYCWLATEREREREREGERGRERGGEGGREGERKRGGREFYVLDTDKL
jgi:hypothetical protein